MARYRAREDAAPLGHVAEAETHQPVGRGGRHGVAVELDRPRDLCAGGGQAEHRPDRGRLADPVASQQDRDARRRHVEAHALQDLGTGDTDP